MGDEKQARRLPPERCPHVAEAADEAVKKVFAILGVDVDVPKEVEQFRENLRFGAGMRRAADKGMLAIIGVIAALFAAIGTFYGVGDGVTTFNVPDYRGYFLRALGTNANGTASGARGTKVADDNKAHAHASSGGSSFIGGGSGAGANVSTGGGSFVSVSVASSGGAEARPKNIAVLTCIKL